MRRRLSLSEATSLSFHRKCCSVYALFTRRVGPPLMPYRYNSLPRYAMTVQFMSTPRPSSTHFDVSPEL